MKILVIDDEKDMCTLIERVIRKKGFEVESTTSPSKAIDLVEKGEFALIIVDLRMPEMGGIEFIKKARRSGFKNRWILITAYPSLEAVGEAKNQGAYDVLVKPLNILELEDTVLRAVSSSENKEVMRLGDKV